MVLIDDHAKKDYVSTLGPLLLVRSTDRTHLVLESSHPSALVEP